MSWLFSTNRIECSESFSKQPTELIVELNSSLRHIIVTIVTLIHDDLLLVELSVFYTFYTFFHKLFFQFLGSSLIWACRILNICCCLLQAIAVVKSKQMIFEFRRVQIDELPRTLSMNKFLHRSHKY